MSKKKNRKQRRKGRELRLAVDNTKEETKGKPPRSVLVIEADIGRHRTVLRQSRLRFNFETTEMQDLYDELTAARLAARV